MASRALSQLDIRAATMPATNTAARIGGSQFIAIQGRIWSVWSIVSSGWTSNMAMPNSTGIIPIVR